MYFSFVNKVKKHMFQLLLLMTLQGQGHAIFQ